MQRDGKRVMGRGDFILSTDRRSFFNAGLQETRHGTDHRIILAVLRGEEALRNCCYLMGADLLVNMAEGNTSPDRGGGQPLRVSKGRYQGRCGQINARESWISQETWKLADRRAALQRAHRASARGVGQT